MTSLPLDDAAVLFSTLADFFQVAVHSILFYRHLYPPRAFLSTTAWDVPVHQCRHPDVCAWVADAVRHVMDQVAAGGVEHVALAVHGPDDETNETNESHETNAVQERWVFDVGHLPAWPGGAAGLHKALASQRDTDDAAELEADLRAPGPGSGPGSGSRSGPGSGPSVSPLHQQLRGIIQRIAAAGTSLSPLPPRCTFSMAVEVGTNTDPPPAWLPAIPSTSSPPATTTTPLRAVHADPLFLECWVEERAGL